MAGGTNPTSDSGFKSSVDPSGYTSKGDFTKAYAQDYSQNGTQGSGFNRLISGAAAGDAAWKQYQQGQQAQAQPMGSGGKQAGNPQSPPPGAMNGYAQPYNGGISVNDAMTPDGAGGYVMRPPEPSFGGNPPPSMMPTPAVQPSPPTNPVPMGGASQQSWQAQGSNHPWSPFGAGEQLPPDRMPQRSMFGGFNPFGPREQNPGVPTWSQQGSTFSYDPNGHPEQQGPFGGMFNRMFDKGPFGGMFNGGQMPDFATFQQQMQDYIQQMRDRPRPDFGRERPHMGDNLERYSGGLGAINPFNKDSE